MISTNAQSAATFMMKLKATLTTVSLLARNLLIFRKIGYVRPAVLTKVPSRRWTNAAMKAVASAAAFFY